MVSIGLFVLRVVAGLTVAGHGAQRASVLTSTRIRQVVQAKPQAS
jgi:hypothetical protein